MRRVSGKNLSRIVAIAVLLIAMLAGCVIGRISAKRQAMADNGKADWQSDDEYWQDTVIYKGREYERNRDLETVLFLGIDDTELAGEHIGEAGRSDVILLVIVDQKQHTMRMLEISRDTITDIDVYDQMGEFLYTAHMQLCMQYSFGDSPERSCYLTRNKVSQLLYGIPINYCFSLDVGGIQPLLDEIGGITVKMRVDCTDINPKYKQDAVVHMDGAEAEHFIRTRDTTHSGGNDQRMERQNWFLLEVIRQIQHNDKYSITEMQDMASPYVVSDLDIFTLALLRDSDMLEDSVKVPGETRLGEVHDEYHVDDEALQALLIELFYLPKQ